MQYNVHMNGIAEHPTGYLELILGPMWSGKTSRLLDLQKQYEVCGVRSLLINYSGDAERGVAAGSVRAHDGRAARCRTVASLADVPAEEIKGAKVLLVNEAQFFPDAAAWIGRAVDEEGKRVHAAGLDGDFLRRPFGSWLELIPLADTISKLRAFCGGCRVREALFSHRTCGSTEVRLIGAGTLYRPLCRQCYLDAVGQKVLEGERREASIDD